MNNNEIDCLRIRDWNELYETAETRKRKFLHWTPLPNHFDGSKYSELVDCPDGVAPYAAWCAMLSIASRATQANRGYLVKSGATPHTPASWRERPDSRAHL